MGPHANPDDALDAAADYQRRARTLLKVARDQLGLEKFAGGVGAVDATNAASASAAAPIVGRTRRASAGGSASTR